MILTLEILFLEHFSTYDSQTSHYAAKKKYIKNAISLHYASSY